VLEDAGLITRYRRENATTAYRLNLGAIRSGSYALDYEADYSSGYENISQAETVASDSEPLSLEAHKVQVSASDEDPLAGFVVDTTSDRL
jgi:hypothetical protein